MLPALWPGDVVQIACCKPEDVRPGEIVLALRDGRFFLHRLVARSQPSGFVLRGDSMPGSDPPFPLEAFLGRLVNHNADRVFGPKWSRVLGLLLCHCSLGAPSRSEASPAPEAVRCANFETVKSPRRIVPWS